MPKRCIAAVRLQQGMAERVIRMQRNQFDPPLFHHLGRPDRLRSSVAEILTGLLIDLTHAQFDLAAVVKPQHLDLDAVAELDDIADFADAMRGQFTDMDEPVARTEEIHKSAKIDGLDHLAVVDGAEFRLGDDPADPIDGGLRGIAVGTPPP